MRSWSRKRLDLRRRLGAAVGDDLLEHPQPRFDSLHVLRILRALLGGQIALGLDLLFLDRSHILNGTIQMALTGIKTQIQLDGSSTYSSPLLRRPI